jgi:Spy/CpxP family protein refolding chaperone
MKRKSVILIAMCAAMFALAAALVSAQQQPQTPQPPEEQQTPRPPHPPMDPMGDAMFPPDMIMQHQRELGLTDEQRAFMRSEINKTTTRFNDLQWQLQDAMEALHETMKANLVDEQQALAQLNRVLDSEREIKTLHMQLAIRLKNKLTPEQQEKLRAMHHDMGRGPEGGPGPGRGPGHPPGPKPPEGQPKPEGAPPTGTMW